MKCLKCGFENVKNATYCINCGSRIDGNIVCPKCGEVISPDCDFCPKCGKKIPHNSAENDTAKQLKKDKLKSIFQLISTILVLVALSSSLVFVWGSYIKVNNNVSPFYGYSFYYLFISWAEMIKNLSNEAGAFYNSPIIISTITSFIIVLANIIVTCVFAIKGIISAAKNLTAKQQKHDFYIYLVIVVVSNLVATRMLKSSIYFPDRIYPNISLDSVNAFILLGCLTLISVAILNIIASFDNKKITLFIERLIFLSSFILVLIYLSTLDASILRAKYSMGSLTTWLDLLSIFESYVNQSSFITAFVLSGISIIFKLFIYTSLATLAIFYVVGCFSGKEHSMRYKIPYYSLSLALLVFSLIYMTLNITLVAFLNKVPYIYGEPTITHIVLSTNIWSDIILTIFVFGTSIASLSLSRSYNHSQKLAEKTTVK